MTEVILYIYKMLLRTSNADLLMNEEMHSEALIYIEDM